MNLQQLKDFVRGYHFVWIGQDATTGSAHPITGNLSYYGEFIAFKSKGERDQYYDNFRSNGFEHCIKCTPSTGRKFKLGLSVLSYYEFLSHCVMCNRP